MDYYKYYQEQKENYIDLSEIKNESARVLADHIFTKSCSNLDQNITNILLDDETENADIFCTLVDILLYGIDILTQGQNTIFDLTDTDDPIIDKIKKYFESMKIKIIVKELGDKTKKEIDEYRGGTNYYCEVLPRPSPGFCFKGWYILNYRIIDNKEFIFDTSTNIDIFKAIFVSTKRIMYELGFSLMRF